MSACRRILAPVPEISRPEVGILARFFPHVLLFGAGEALLMEWQKASRSPRWLTRPAPSGARASLPACTCQAKAASRWQVVPEAARETRAFPTARPSGRKKRGFQGARLTFWQNGKKSFARFPPPLSCVKNMLYSIFLVSFRHIAYICTRIALEKTSCKVWWFRVKCLPLHSLSGSKGCKAGLPGAKKKSSLKALHKERDSSTGIPGG